MKRQEKGYAKSVEKIYEQRASVKTNFRNFVLTISTLNMCHVLKDG